jgi:prefoldin alpha subunit
MTKKEVTMTGPQVRALYERDQAKFNALRQKHAQMQQLIAETVNAIETLKKVKDSDKNERMKVLLGAGVYAEVTLADKENVETVLAGSTLLKKTVEQAVKDLEERRQGLQDQIKQVVNEEQKLANELGGLSNVINQAQQHAMEQAKKARLEKKEKGDKAKK